MARFMYRLGRFAARRRWVVLGAWLLAAVVMVAVIRDVGANTSNNLELPGTGSQDANDLLAERFPPQQNGKNPIVFRTESGKVTDSENKSVIEQSHEEIVALPDVVSAPSPFSQEGSSQISSDGRIAFIPVLLSIGNEEITEEIAQRFLDAAKPAREAGMEVAAGGQIGTELSEPATESSEVIGMVAAMIILAFTFGTLVAMGMPLISAVTGLLIGLSLIGLLGHVVQVPEIAPTLATMIGLGVGIDYALFMVSRYRLQRAEGDEIPEAVATAVATSGTAIVFAGTTVVIALVTLLIARIPLVTSLGYASAFAVVTAVLAAVTLLPAVLAVVGRHIDSLALPAFLHPGSEPGGNPGSNPGHGGLWNRWAHFVTTHPGRAILIWALIMAPLIIPFLSLELGQEDIGATPKSTTERQAYDLTASGFGPGYNGPLLIAVELGTPAKPSATFNKQYKQAQSLQQQLEAEQEQGEIQAASLESQAAGLVAEQARLEAEKASLGSEAGDLEGEKSQLQKSIRALKKQRGLLAEAESVLAESRRIAGQQAALAKQAAALAREQQRNPSTATAQRLEETRQEVRALKSEAQALKQRSGDLRKRAARAGGKGFGVATDAASAARQALGLVEERNQLVQEAAAAQVEAAQLETGKVQLEALQQQAKTQQQQAEKLKKTLTDDLTAAGGDKRGTDSRLVSLQDALTATIGVQLVSPPDINKSGNATVFTLIAEGDPADPETAELVRTLRTYTIPQATADTNLTTYVGGQTASYVDLADAIASKLALVIFVVNALGFLVLLMAFRSMLVSAQAAVAIAISVCAAFGVVTACFQFGWGLGLVGVETDKGSDPIASYVPLIMFAVLFGLSMDYHVFLMSQIEQHRARVEDTRAAVVGGLATGARVIAAAALIMFSVFASFILNGDPTVKQFGVGLAVGVLLAATSVLLFTPAMLVLAHRGAWWVPAWADRFLPRLDIEGAGAGGKGSGGGDSGGEDGDGDEGERGAETEPSPPPGRGPRRWGSTRL